MVLFLPNWLEKGVDCTFVKRADSNSEVLFCDLRNHGRKGVEYEECDFREAFGDESHEQIWNLPTQ